MPLGGVAHNLATSHDSPLGLLWQQLVWHQLGFDYSLQLASVLSQVVQIFKLICTLSVNLIVLTTHYAHILLRKCTSESDET